MKKKHLLTEHCSVFSGSSDEIMHARRQLCYIKGARGIHNLGFLRDCLNMELKMRAQINSAPQ